MSPAAPRPKSARLDQILFRLGFATQDQITRALQRQQAHGGRLGLHLVQMGFVTEHQLVEALAEQFGLSWRPLDESSVPVELVPRMPPDLVEEGRMLPLAWDEGLKVLTVAVGDPGDGDALQRVAEAFGARRVHVTMAPDSSLQDVGRRLAAGGTVDRIELPELFAVDEAAPARPTAPLVEMDPTRRVLMVSPGAPRKTFLPPVLAREGIDLVVVEERDEVVEALGEGGFEAVLVAQDAADLFDRWVRAGDLPPLPAEVSVFPSVSGALLGNPVSYDVVVRSLRYTVEALADLRASVRGHAPPYALVASDVERLAREFDLRRIVRDALHLAVHLLLPATGTSTAPGRPRGEPFADFMASRELALRLRFPLPLDQLLEAVRAILSGEGDPGQVGSWGVELHRAAGLVALAWHRHTRAELPRGEEGAGAFRAALREQASGMVPLDVVEAYLRIIEEQGGGVEPGGTREVLLVGGDRMVELLQARFARSGIRALVTVDLADAQTLAQRRPPAAVIIDGEAFPGQVGGFSRVAKLDVALRVFVVLESRDPSATLSLLDAGVDDVFAPPHDFDVIVARVARAVRGRTAPEAKRDAGHFAAPFSAFSFLDLVQALGHGLKSVRVDLRRGDGLTAVLYLERGRLVHAECGEEAGAEAVYRVIAWEDDGEFTVHPETHFPAPTIQQPIDSVLMEGCRLLDESRA